MKRFIPKNKKFNPDTGELEDDFTGRASYYPSEIKNNKTGEVIFEIDNKTGEILIDKRDKKLKKHHKEKFGIPG